MNDVLFTVAVVAGYVAVGFASAVIAARVSKSVCEDGLSRLFLLAWPLVLPLALLIYLAAWAERLGCRDA
jgi:hypothetical protein